MEKKKIVLVSLVGLLLIVLVVMVFLVFKNENGGKKNTAYEPQFLSAEQKSEFGLRPETKAQVFYDEEGNLIYKIIRNDEDLVLKPEEFKN